MWELIGSFVCPRFFVSDFMELHHRTHLLDYCSRLLFDYSPLTFIRSVIVSLSLIECLTTVRV